MQKSLNLNEIQEIIADIYSKLTYPQYVEHVNSLNKLRFDIIGQIKSLVRVSNVNPGSNYRLYQNDMFQSVQNASCLGGSLRTNNAYLIIPIGPYKDSGLTETKNSSHQSAVNHAVWSTATNKQHLLELTQNYTLDQYMQDVFNLVNIYQDMYEQCNVKVNKGVINNMLSIHFNNKTIYSGYNIGCLIRNLFCLESHYARFTNTSDLGYTLVENIIYTMYHQVAYSNSKIPQSIYRSSDGNIFSCPPLTTSQVSSLDELLKVSPKTIRFDFNNLNNAYTYYGY